MINMTLAKALKVSDDNISKIKALQKFSDDLRQNMQDSDPKDKLELRKLFKSWKQNEFDLQSLWGFKQIEMYHKDYLLPHCNCPVLDNDEVYPYRRFKRDNCVYHGVQ